MNIVFGGFFSNFTNFSIKIIQYNLFKKSFFIRNIDGRFLRDLLKTCSSILKDFSMFKFSSDIGFLNIGRSFEFNYKCGNYIFRNRGRLFNQTIKFNTKHLHKSKGIHTFIWIERKFNSNKTIKLSPRNCGSAMSLRSTSVSKSVCNRC